MDKPHKKLQVWQKSMELVEDVYRVTAEFPDTERFGLTNQMRRCAVSIPSNIAEGAARQSAAEFQQFIHIAMGSASELDTQLEIGKRLGLIPASQWTSINTNLQAIDRMLSGLRNHVRTKGRNLRTRANKEA